MAKEFFMLLSQRILNPDFGMFVEDEESHFMWFRDGVSHVTVMWLTICGCGGFQRRCDMRHELLTQHALFCIGVNAKKGTLSQHFVTHNYRTSSGWVQGWGKSRDHAGCGAGGTKSCDSHDAAM